MWVADSQIGYLLGELPTVVIAYEPAVYSNIPVGRCLAQSGSVWDQRRYVSAECSGSLARVAVVEPELKCVGDLGHPRSTHGTFPAQVECSDTRQISQSAPWETRAVILGRVFARRAICHHVDIVRHGLRHETAEVGKGEATGLQQYCVDAAYLHFGKVVL